MEFLKSLITVTEKAANIARVIRQNDRLFKLLVEKKESDEANRRFVEDFKTLADVLIQQMVKYNIGRKFPEIRDKIFGEESNEFCNKLGEKIIVEIQITQEETSNLLCKVLNGDQETANILATEVFKEVNIEDVNTKIPEEDLDIEVDKLGIWIDPIDATAEYINGEQRGCQNGIYLSGLKCVTILVGAFHQETGQPVIGVINQPFAPKNSKSFRCNWGVAAPSAKTLLSSIILNETRQGKVAVLSSTESPMLKEKLKESGFEIVESCGAGYKLLTVILGLADIYILSKASTYFWDTCAPHAVLRSAGGNIISYKKALTNNSKEEIVYTNVEQKCNFDGLIAYIDDKMLEQTIQILKSLENS